MTPGTLTTVATAVLAGLAFAAGVSLWVSLVPRWGAPSLTSRIAAYVRDVGDPIGVTPCPAAVGEWGGSPRGAWRTAQRRVASAVGGSEPIARRLAQAAWPMDAVGYRGRQLGWALGGLLAGGILVVVLALAGRLSPLLVVLPPVCAVLGILGCDVRLARAARARTARIEEELPTVLEFLALCLTAGEGLLDSIRRVSAVGVGELAGELRAVVLAVDTGSPLSDALRDLAVRVQRPALTRSVDHLIAAIERGAPLAHVLQAQAVDAREEAKRTLIEQAGRKEIFMLIPLVFLILPLSVVFAVYPGVFMLRLGVE